MTRTLSGPAGSLSRGAGVLSVPGVRVGHWASTDPGALTGTTVLLPPPGSSAGVDVRGGGPATHETSILEPGTHTEGADAFVLTGGSAYGLVAATGVQLALAAEGRGFPVAGGMTVPIVPAASIFDLARGGIPAVFHTADSGRAAHADAAGNTRVRGSYGAGLGARTALGSLRGGLGSATIRTRGGALVSALVVVNAFGSVFDPHGRPYAAGVLADFGIELDPATRVPTTPTAHVARSTAGTAASGPGTKSRRDSGPGDGARNTTIAVVVTDAGLDSAQVTRLAASAHAGLARAIRPSHTLFDGDTVFATATGPRDSGPSTETLVELGAAAADALSIAVVDAVMSAGDDDCRLEGTPAVLRDLEPGLVAAWDRLLPSD